MTTTYVAVDLETTGLDPTRDAIIEVGVVRFSGNDVLDEYGALVNPLRDIPPFVTQLTGITDEMVVGKPGISDVLPRFRRFVGDAVAVT